MLAGLIILSLTALVAWAICTHRTPRTKRSLAHMLIDAANGLVACSVRLYASADADECRRQCYAERRASIAAAFARQGKETA